VRIAAVSLPELRVEMVRASAKEGDEAARLGHPLAIVVAPPPTTDASLLGNTRIDVVSREARRLGVRPGQTIAQARARAANLAVRVVRPESVRGELERLAEVALAFGATVAFSAAGTEPAAGRKGAVEVVAKDDLVWVDVTGCAHFHEGGEATLATRLAHVIEGLGHACAVAVADGPRIAAILARVCASARIRDRVSAPESDPPVVVVPPGKNAVALAPLPVALLPLPDEDVRWLVKVGVRTIADLSSLPRAALASRLGARAPVVLTLASGDDRAPLTPYVPPELPEESVSFEYGVEGTDALTFVAKTLTDRIALRLAGRGIAASRIELTLSLDAALLDAALLDAALLDAGGAPNAKQHVRLELPAPLSTASDLLAALRPRIERLELRAPALAARLRVLVTVPKPQATLSLFEAQPKADRALPRLVAELVSDLGDEAVGQLALGDAWAPEDRSKLVRLAFGAKGQAGGPGGKRKRRHLVSSVPEPTRILPEPVPVPRDAVKIVRHLARLEAVDWWKQLPGEGRGRAKRGVDHVYAWVDEGPAWVELDRASGAAHVRGWFD